MLETIEELLAKNHRQLDKLLGAVLAAIEGENSVEVPTTLERTALRPSEIRYL